MKKIIAMLLCLVMVFTLCACSTQGFPQNGAGLLAMIKEALQNISLKISVRIPASVPGPVDPGAFSAP